MLDYSKSFIETQFPVSKISKESYKERKANLGQTLTGLGKWWGRKPLILVRATLLGVLMPVSNDPIKDREIFLKILTMDEEGLWLRKSKNIPLKDLFANLTPVEISKYFDITSPQSMPKYLPGISADDKKYIQKLVFNRLSYDNKLKYCLRPENLKLENKEEWDEINIHLETDAYSLEELTLQLGEKRFGHRPKVGDCFAGGGSIPFESARIGAKVYASDLNPTATLLTWGSIKVGSADKIKLDNLRAYQDKIYTEINKYIQEIGIETNEHGHRADSYLYCFETVCPECSYRVPLAPSWIIGKGTKTVAMLEENSQNSFDIRIIQNADKETIIKASQANTIRRQSMYCPHCNQETPISSIRGDRRINGKISYGLRKWEQNEIRARKDDIFQERLYAIRYRGEKGRYFTEPSLRDFENEKNIFDLLSDRLKYWQDNDIIPKSIIGNITRQAQPSETMGWQYWHQLFNPRQLFTIGLFQEAIRNNPSSTFNEVIASLGVNKLVNFNSRLSMWVNGAGVEKVVHVFTNQALNTFYNYGCRPMLDLSNLWYIDINTSFKSNSTSIQVSDAREIVDECDVWITDPPYADAVNYHELSEFFLMWDKNVLEKHFPEWGIDSRRLLAVRGTGKSFNDNMIDVYSNIRKHMPQNGYQVVMFTHQDVKVWSELAMILWSSGLHVVSAWNIATETDATGLKGGGNYVKGTVLLTLKKQTSDETAFQDELYDEIKYEVTSIIDSMKDIDDKDDPDFTDADYLLASYASSLKVLTKYKEIDGIDVQYWLSQPRENKDVNPVEELINKAVRIAYDHLIPEGFEKGHWVDLKPEERFYIRGLEIEMNGSQKISSYQELARGFGVADYQDMFSDFKANSARLKTPSEFKMLQLGSKGFGETLLRNLLVAVNETTNSQSTQEGRTYLKNAFKEDNNYWYKKPLMIELLGFIANLEFVSHMEHWHEHARSAKILKEALRNEGV